MDFQNNEHDIYQAKSGPNDPVDEHRSSRRRLDYFAGANSLHYIVWFWFAFLTNCQKYSNSVLACFIFFISYGPIYIYHVLRCFDVDIPMNQCYIVDQWLKMLPWLRKVFEIAMMHQMQYNNFYDNE